MKIFRNWKEKEKEEFEKEKTKIFLGKKAIKKEHNKVKAYPIDPIECNPKILDKERK